MKKTVFSSDHDIYTTLAVIDIEKKELVCIYQLEFDDDDELEYDDPRRIKEIDDIIKFHYMEKIERCYPIIAYSDDTNRILVDNYGGDIDIIGYLRYMLIQKPKFVNIGHNNNLHVVSLLEKLEKELMWRLILLGHEDNEINKEQIQEYIVLLLKFIKKAVDRIRAC